MHISASRVERWICKIDLLMFFEYVIVCSALKFKIISGITTLLLPTLPDIADSCFDFELETEVNNLCHAFYSNTPEAHQELSPV